MSVPSYYVQPAQQTSLGVQGHALQPKLWTPNRGLVLRSSLPMLPEDSCTVAQNVRWNGICWTTQGIGWSAVRATPFGNGPILEQAVHWTTTGAQLYVHQAGTMVQTYDPTTPTTSETTIFTASVQSLPCMRSFSPNFFLYVNGHDTPQVWTGSGSMTPMSMWPITPSGGPVYNQPSIVETFNNRAVYAGFPNDPYGVLISDFGNPNSCTLNNPSSNPLYGGIYDVPSQLGPVTSLKAVQMSLSSNQQLLFVGCQNGFAIITGTGFGSFSMVPVQYNKWGMLSNRAWFVIDGTAYGLCTDGIRPFPTNAYISNLISNVLTYPVHPIITGLGTLNGASAFCLDNPSQLEVVFYACSGSDSQNRTGLILNYGDLASSGLIRFSTKVFPAIPTGGTPYSPACGVLYKGNYYAGGWDGLLQQHYTSNLFNGVGINYLIGSPLFQAPTPAQEASSRGFWILSQGNTTQFNALCYGWVPQANGLRLNRTLLLSTPVSFNTNGTTALGVNFTLGSATFGGIQYEITPVNPAGAARAWEFQMAGNTSQGDLNLIGVFNAGIAGGTRQ